MKRKKIIIKVKNTCSLKDTKRVPFGDVIIGPSSRSSMKNTQLLVDHVSEYDQELNLVKQTPIKK